MRSMKWLLLCISVLLFGYMFFCPVSAHAQQVPSNTTCNQYSYLLWDMQDTAKVEGFNIYQSPSPITQKPQTPIAKILVKDYQNPLMTVLVPLPNGPTYFRVTSYGAGLESDLSNQIGCLYQKQAGVDLWRMITLNADKGSTGDTFLSFKVNVDSIVYVMHDTRVTEKPTWLATYTPTSELLTTSDGISYQIFSKEFPAGLVVLGGNQSGGNSSGPHFSMYGVAVLGKTPDSRITEVKTPSNTYQVVPLKAGVAMYADRDYQVAGLPNLMSPGLMLVIPKNLQLNEGMAQ